MVFFSWQKTRPSSEHWSLIESGLEKAAVDVGRQLDLEVEITRDSQGVPGAPLIFDEIKAKLDRCDVAVFDLTNVGKLVNERACPNPNVLVELGYALHRLPTERIVLVMNTEYGGVDTLPFDIQKSRVVAYQLEPGGKKPPERTRLREALVDTLATVLRVPIAHSLNAQRRRRLMLLGAAVVLGIALLLGGRFFIQWIDQRIYQRGLAAALGGF